MLRNFFAAMAILLSLSSNALASPYIALETISPTLISPPLEVNSAPWKKEIKHILALQKKATPYAIKKAEAERNMSPELITLAVDSTLTRESFPALYALLDRVSKTSYAITGPTKDYWNTKRPYIADKRVKALIQAHDNPAYPSGHTSGSYLWAHALGQVLPEKRKDFMDRAEEIAQHRVLVGMHFPHDVVGGKELAFLMMGALSQSSEFQDDLKKAQTEMEKEAP